jgi:hypothetical protein
MLFRSGRRAAAADWPSPMGWFFEPSSAEEKSSGSGVAQKHALVFFSSGCERERERERKRQTERESGKKDRKLTIERAYSTYVLSFALPLPYFSLSLSLLLSLILLLFFYYLRMKIAFDDRR